MPRRRREITYKDAEAYKKLVMKRFASWLDSYGEPTIVEDWDGDGHFAICWEGPYEWAYYGTSGSFEYEEREPEFGFVLPKVEVPASLKHIFSEPYNQGVVILYLAD